VYDEIKIFIEFKESKMITFFSELKPKLLNTRLTVAIAIAFSFMFPIFLLQNVEAKCTEFEKATQTITVNCKSVHMNDIYIQVDNEKILSKDANREWLLNANIIVNSGSSLYIDSSDTSWLKINSDGVNAFGIYVFGNLIIDSVKITSWNKTTREVAPISEGEIPRPFIRIEDNGTGTTNITNSEIAYLGYNEEKSKGINYYSGNGSVIRGNKIHHLYFGIYFAEIDNILIESNEISHNLHYGLDPHTGSTNILIRNNTVHHNGGQGIICSVDCSHIVIENNKVYDNSNAGIMLSRNTQNSIVSGNNINDEVFAIFVSSSHNNKIYNNSVTDIRTGIYLKAGSSHNQIFNNTIVDPTSTGLLINDQAANNTLYSNTIINAPMNHSIVVQEEFGAEPNIFENNRFLVNR
jgi:parallel beta-helix repeat protein